MRNYSKSAKLYKIFIIFGVMFFGVAILSGNVLVLTWLILIQTILLCMYFYTHLEENILIFLFIIAFSLFDMGLFYTHLFDETQWWNSIKGSMVDYSFEESEITKTLTIMFISIMIILVGYKSAFRIKFKIGSKKTDKKTEKETILLHMRKILRFLTYISFVGNMLYILYRVYMVLNNSYVFLYTDYYDIWILKMFSLIFNVVFFCFLATEPSKLEAKIPTYMFLISAITNIFTGSRSATIVSMFFVIYYYFLRSQNNRDEKWISRKIIVYFAIAAPIIFASLSIVSSLRNNKAIEGTIWDYALRFLGGQGESGLLLTETIAHGNDFAYYNVNYTFGGLIRYLQNNPFWCDIFNLKNLEGVATQSEMNALYGNTFGCAISYYMMKYTFLNGYSMGSCYLAELWFDYGWGGILLGNFLLGILIYKFSWIKNSGFIGKSIMLGVVPSLFSIGRASTTSLITFFLSSAVWIMYILIFLLYFYIKRKVNKS